MKKINRQLKILLALLVVSVVTAAALLAANYSKFFFKADTSGTSAISMSGGGAYKVGSEYNVSVNIDTGGNDVAAAQVAFNYPANLLQYESVSKGSGWSLDFDSGSSSGVVNWAVGSTNGVNGSVTLFTVKFKAIAAGTGSFDVTKGDVAKVDTTKISSTLSGASFTVSVVESTTGESTTGESTTDNTPNTSDTSNTTSGTSSTTSTTNKKTTTTTNKNSTPSPSAATSTTAQATISPPVFVSVSFSDSAVLDTAEKRTKGIIFTGTADPSNNINLIINSDPIAASTTSDSDGKWSYTLDQWLPDGQHSIGATAQKDSLTSTMTSTHFVVNSSDKSQIAYGSTLSGSAPAIPAVQASTAGSKRSLKQNIILFGSIGGGIVLAAIIVLIIMSSIKKKKKAFEFEKINFRDNNDNILIKKPLENENLGQIADNLPPAPTEEALAPEIPETPKNIEEPIFEKPQETIQPSVASTLSENPAVLPDNIEEKPANVIPETTETAQNNSLSNPSQPDIAVNSENSKTEIDGSITIDKIEEAPKAPPTVGTESNDTSTSQQVSEPVENSPSVDHGSDIEYGFNHNTSPNNFYKPSDHSGDNDPKKV